MESFRRLNKWTFHVRVLYVSWFGGMVDFSDDIGYIFRVSLPRIFHLTLPTLAEFETFVTWRMFENTLSRRKNGVHLEVMCLFGSVVSH